MRKKYRSEYSHIKVLSFAKSFLKYLTKVRLDTRYRAFEIFLERPRAIKARNNVTNRIVTKDDIENVLDHVNARKGLISDSRVKHYLAFVLFYVYSAVNAVKLQFLS